MAHSLVDLEHCHAVLFDMDGVITATDRVHMACWKSVFDRFLHQYASNTGCPFHPFDPDADYRKHVDGKLRYQAVASFLGSRGIILPRGSPTDAPDLPTICGLGNAKDAMVAEILARDGVEVYPDAVALAKWLADRNRPRAVVSSSPDCTSVLKQAGVLELFPVRVDATYLRRRGLRGKPFADPFVAAARVMGVDPKRSVVLEDAVAGVQAARSGGFGLIVGVMRHGGDERLLFQAGADRVTDDLTQLIPKSRNS